MRNLKKESRILVVAPLGGSYLLYAIFRGYRGIEHLGVVRSGEELEEVLREKKLMDEVNMTVGLRSSEDLLGLGVLPSEQREFLYKLLKKLELLITELSSKTRERKG